MKSSRQVEPTVAQEGSRRSLLNRLADAFFGPKSIGIPILEESPGFLVAANIPDRFWITDESGSSWLELNSEDETTPLPNRNNAAVRTSDFLGSRIVVENQDERKLVVVSPLTRLRRVLFIGLFGLAVNIGALISALLVEGMLEVAAVLVLVGLGVLGLVGLRRSYFRFSALCIALQLAVLLAVNLHGLVFWLGEVSVSSARVGVMLSSAALVLMIREALAISKFSCATDMLNLKGDSEYGEDL